MKRYLPLVTAGAAAAILFPAAMSGRTSSADAAPPVQPSVVLAAVHHAEAERKAAIPQRVAPAAEAASLDRMAGAAEKIDPARIDANVAAGALAR